MSDKVKTKTFRVTDAAGTRPDIAGKRRRVGDVLDLTEAEAEFEISRGTIKPVSKAEAAASEPEAKPRKAAEK